jgi:ubiquinone/menaquinone biosynthesis C-methylase UbiE
MNAQHALDFSDSLFDVVQARLITSFMLAEAWPNLIRECQRIIKPGGTLCLIEGESFGISNSASLEQYNALLAQAMRRANHCFAPEGNMFGITALLPRLLEDQGFQRITQQAYSLNFSAGRKANATWYTNYKTAMKLVQPFLIKWEVTTQKDVDILYERALQDILTPTFCGQWFYLSASGTKPA